MKEIIKYLPYIILIILLLCQGLWVFLDARKRGEKYYWLWGLFCSINIPSNILVYLIVTRIIRNKNNMEGNK